MTTMIMRMRMMKMMRMLRMMRMLITYGAPSTAYHSHLTRQLPPTNSSFLDNSAPVYRIVAVAVRSSSNTSSDDDISSGGSSHSAFLVAPRLFLLLVHEVHLINSVKF
jgi:hypothetical protein